MIALNRCSEDLLKPLRKQYIEVSNANHYKSCDFSRVSDAQHTPWLLYALPQDDSVRAAFELLLKAGDVNGSSVGITGAKPKEYDAFKTLWKAGKAAKDYALRLVLDGTPAARVYGAILLLELDEAVAKWEFRAQGNKSPRSGIHPSARTI